ncbi:hypothetical protein SAMN04488544_0392 [Microlunatus sagamiharensis]|uniref:Uncharacterized protein n=1 Tax=Microlunatus sagamiharensis TaxID=546874 RepID=A0A1H2LLB2_9ACTN|nr:hypothetical protein [Microlunatus sagamiharensis]SDU81428.1 hypothetical protein SAMN04488544_0392 [Microlunatus sagamiharensis]
MTQEPRHEVEVRGLVGEPVALPLGAARAGASGEPAYAWSLELPEEVEQTHDLHVRASEPGSYVLVATQTDPAGVAITVLPVRLTGTRPGPGPRVPGPGPG